MYKKPKRVVQIPQDIRPQFEQDVQSNKYTTRDLARMYEVHRATIDRWKQTLAYESQVRLEQEAVPVEEESDFFVQDATETIGSTTTIRFTSGAVSGVYVGDILLDAYKIPEREASIEFSFSTPQFESAVVVNDLHVPYLDLKAWKAVLGLIDFYKVKTIYLNGDILDFPQISRFDNNPERMRKIQDDLDLCEAEVLAPLLSRGMKIVWMDGNHEFRREKYLMQHPEIHNLRSLKMPNLLNLTKHGIEYHPYGEIIPYTKKFVIHHGEFVRQDPGSTAKTESTKHGCSGITGHVHRLAQYKRTTGFGGEITWTENGHLADPSQIDYTMGTPNWQQGFSVLLKRSGSEDVVTETYPIYNGEILSLGYQTA